MYYIRDRIGVWVKVRGAGHRWLKKKGKRLEVKDPKKKTGEGVIVEEGGEGELWGEDPRSLILALGEPSSGKSHTLTSKNQGLLHRRLAKIIHSIGGRSLPLGHVQPNPDGTFLYRPER
jgi:hypothetical protein